MAAREVPELVTTALPGNEEKLAALLEFCGEVVARYAFAQMEHGAHMTSIGESIAGPDVCALPVYSRWARTADMRLVERLAERDVRLAYRVCGDATRIVSEMVDTGAAVLELDCKCDLPAVKAAVAGRALPPEAPMESLHAFVEAARRDGCYEPDGSLAPG